jgi:hypothetical protein
MVLKLHAKDTHPFKAYYNPEKFDDDIFYGLSCDNKNI